MRLIETAGSTLMAGAREVNVTIRSPQWRREGGDGFHAEVIGHPLVPVNPVWHLRKVPGGEIASMYLTSFERVPGTDA